MRKRPILLAAAAVAAGLTVLRTVGAQAPGGYTPPKGNLPATTVRPYGEWTPNQPPPGYVPGQSGAVRPAGGYLPPPAGYTGQPPAGGNPPPAHSGHGLPVGGRPKLTTPVAAGPGGVAPAGYDVPPPNMEMPTYRPSLGGPPPVGPIPPPSVAVDPGAGAEPKAPAGAGAPPAPLFPPGGPEVRTPLVPVPPTPAGNPGGSPPIPPIPAPTPGGVPALPPGVAPVPPITPPGGPAPAAGAPAALPPIPGAGGTSDTAVPLARPTAPGALPARVSQNVVLEAVCPESVVFGQEFRYELIVKNAGTGPVAGVRVEDELPAGAKYVGSDPPAEVNGDRLGWTVGALDAGAEKRITVRVAPADEGEVRSRALVTYTAAVDARTKVTRPRVTVSVTGTEVCKAGEDTVFQIKVNNVGSGPAQRMVLRAELSEGLLHQQGRVIEAELANLPPGESRTVPLKVSAAKAGLQGCQITVAAQGSQDATAKASVNVVEPLLQVKQAGPARCLVRAEPVYEVTLSNPGTAATDPVSVYSVLPEGFEYVQGSDGATYNAANRAVVWKLSGLSPGGTKALTLKLRAAAAADGLLRTIAQAGPEQPAAGVTGAGGLAVRPAARVLESRAETAVKAEGVAAVRFEVRDLEDPVEAGKEALYEIRVTNQGTGACTNVQLVAALAEGTAYTGSSGPTQIKPQGQHLMFDPIPNLPVKGEVVYNVKVRGTTAGDLRFRVQLTCDQVRTPVVKEESTRFVKE